MSTPVGCVLQSVNKSRRMTEVSVSRKHAHGLRRFPAHTHPTAAAAANKCTSWCTVRLKCSRRPACPSTEVYRRQEVQERPRTA